MQLDSCISKGLQYRFTTSAGTTEYLESGFFSKETSKFEKYDYNGFRL